MNDIRFVWRITVVFKQASEAEILALAQERALREEFEANDSAGKEARFQAWLASRYSRNRG
jgi:hypothetical protein